MRCLFCGTDQPGTRVIDSRELDESVRRRRECLSCGQRFTTYERPERTALLIVKKDGRREEFSREKLARGIRAACFKRPIPAEAVGAIVADIEADLHNSGQSEVASRLIGERVMAALREADDVAYVRFASVYRSLGVDTLLDEIEELRRARQRAFETRDQLRLRFEEEQTCWS